MLGKEVVVLVPFLAPFKFKPQFGAKTMDARITVLTTGVDDLERSLVFYRDGLGFETDGIIGTECRARGCGLLQDARGPDTGDLAS